MLTRSRSNSEIRTNGFPGLLQLVVLENKNANYRHAREYFNNEITIKYCIASIAAVGCNDSTADIVFALDASGSIESENFVQVIQFVGDVVQSLMIRTEQTPNGFQVALVSFADSVDIRFNLSTYTNKELLLAAINIPYTRGRTNLDQALR